MKHCLFHCRRWLESPAIPASASAAEPAQADTITIDLDLSIPEVGKARKNRNDKPIEPSAEYVPAKGQKTAARRLNKIKSKHRSQWRANAIFR